MENTPKSRGEEPTENPSETPAAKVQVEAPTKKLLGTRENLDARVNSLRKLRAANVQSQEVVSENWSSSESASTTEVRELENYKHLVARAVDVFGDEMRASEWLSLPNTELNGNTPLQFAQRFSYNGKALEPIFTRIEHGIYV